MATSSKHRRRRQATTPLLFLSLLLSTSTVLAQNCISLSTSTQCKAFNQSSISTDSYLVGLFPFLNGLNTTAQFDAALATYISGAYVQSKFGNLLGCSATIASATNTSSYYARFTRSFLCNAIVQNSISPCSLSTGNSRPLCVDACAEWAESEANIVANSALCANPSITSSRQNTQIRADFTNCGLPTTSFEGTCITAVTNEPNNCGFANNTVGLCSYCRSGTANSTDTCCYNSQAETRCANVVLPTITATLVLSSSTSTSTPTSSANPSPTSNAAAGIATGNGLSGGAIAGIVVGSVVGAALLLGLIFLLLLCCRRRRGSQQGSVLNQPTPARKGPGMAYRPTSSVAPAGYEVLPGGRIARMAALEGHSGNSPPHSAAVAGLAGAGAGYAAGHRRNDNSSSDEFHEHPDSDEPGGVLRPPPTGRRNGSLSSNSLFGLAGENNSPDNGHLSSPDGVGSNQSEQLAFFKDYYSQDEIHPGDKVATLWAYQPRAADEFGLERGDMLKVLGIWDDGWATGVLVAERAEEWDARRAQQRDSGVSNGSKRPGTGSSSTPTSGEIKAFPLVCVCLPQHWKKTIDGNGSTETGSSGDRGPGISV